MKALFNTIHWFLIAGIIAIGLLLLGTLMPIPGNFKVKIVKSGSMEPTIRTGGIVVIRPEASYGLGDIVTFGADTKTQIPTTHRIVDVKGEGSSKVFATKGDANDAPDPTQTHISDIRGKVLFTVPYLGYILDFARKPIGFGLLVGVPAFAIILDEIGKIIREVRKLRRKKRQDQSRDEDSDRTTSGGSMREQSRVEVFTERRMLVDGIIRPPVLAVSSPQRKSDPKKMFGVLLLVLGTFVGLSSVGSTSSYFADTEVSQDNLLQAGAVFLTLSAGNDVQGRVLGFSSLSRLSSLAPSAPASEDQYGDAVGTETFELTVGTGEGSLPLYYSAWGEFDADAPGGCDALNLDLKTDSYSWSGPFTKFVLPATTTTDNLVFTLTLPKDNTLSPGAECSGNLVFRAHPQGISTLISNIFTDEKKYSFSVYNYGESSEIPKVLGDATTTPEIIPPVESTTTATTTPPEIQGGGGGGGSVETPPLVEPTATTTEEATSTPEVPPPADSTSTAPVVPPVVEPPVDPAPADVVPPPAETPSAPVDAGTSNTTQ